MGKLPIDVLTRLDDLTTRDCHFEWVTWCLFSLRDLWNRNQLDSLPQTSKKTIKPAWQLAYLDPLTLPTTRANMWHLTCPTIVNQSSSFPIVDQWQRHVVFFFWPIKSPPPLAFDIQVINWWSSIFKKEKLWREAGRTSSYLWIREMDHAHDENFIDKGTGERKKNIVCLLRFSNEMRENK